MTNTQQQSQNYDNKTQQTSTKQLPTQYNKYRQYINCENNPPEQWTITKSNTTQSPKQYKNTNKDTIPANSTKQLPKQYNTYGKYIKWQAHHQNRTQSTNTWQTRSKQVPNNHQNNTKQTENT